MIMGKLKKSEFKKQEKQEDVGVNFSYCSKLSEEKYFFLILESPAY